MSVSFDIKTYRLKIIYDMLEYNVILFPIESNWLRHGYYFPPNIEQEYRTKFEILPGKLFKNIIE